MSATTNAVVANATTEGKRTKASPEEVTREQARRAMVRALPFAFRVEDSGDTYLAFNGSDELHLGRAVEVAGGWDFLSPGPNGITYFQTKEGEQVSKKDQKEATYRAFANSAYQHLGDIFGTSREQVAKDRAELRALRSADQIKDTQLRIFATIMRERTVPSAEDLIVAGAEWCDSMLLPIVESLPDEALRVAIADAVVAAFSDPEEGDPEEGDPEEGDPEEGDPEEAPVSAPGKRERK